MYIKAIWILDDFIYLELLKFEGSYLCMDYVVGLLCFGTVFFLQHAKCVRVEL